MIMKRLTPLHFLAACWLVLLVVHQTSSVREVQTFREVTADELLHYGVVVGAKTIIPPGDAETQSGNTSSSAARATTPPASYGTDPVPPLTTSRGSSSTWAASQVQQTSQSQAFATTRMQQRGNYAGPRDKTTYRPAQRDLSLRSGNAASGSGGSKLREDLSDSDFVFVAGTYRKRMSLARGSRGWRSTALRAFFLTDANSSLLSLNEAGVAVNESYAFFPSEGSPLLGGAVRGLRNGDTRAAVAPFAAHRHLGDSYKWMLYGDDDTIFFMDSVKELLWQYDYNLPLALSDNLWSRDRHPNPHAPRCLPCHTANEELPTLDDILHSSSGREDIRITLAQQKLPTTQSLVMAFAANTTLVAGARYRPQPACPHCTREAACMSLGGSGPCQHATAHGGAGIILSVGLLRSIPYRNALECVLSIQNTSGGDDLFAQCLWRNNIAFTDPGELVRHMYERHHVVFGAGPAFPALLDPNGPAAAQGACDEWCEWALRHIVTMHLKARLTKDWKGLVRQQEELPRLRAEACKRLLS